MSVVTPASSPAFDVALFIRLAERMSFAISHDQLGLFERYATELVDWNRRINLTRMAQPDEIAARHFVDSLVCLRALALMALADERSVPEGSESCGPQGLRLIDVGAGAGLPGLPLKIVRPEIRLTLLESVGKKAGFLEHLVASLGLSSVEVVCARAETAGRDPLHRAQYDLSVSRAVAKLPVLAEYMLPFLSVGGRGVALKGADIDEELTQLRPALELLGGGDVTVEGYEIPEGWGAGCLVSFRKLEPTPSKYPRRPGIPQKRPLGTS